VRKVHLLPNLLTLANSFCGLLAICKGIDALQATPDRFYANLATARWRAWSAGGAPSGRNSIRSRTC
jgi:phosphatidylserine synthase